MISFILKSSIAFMISFIILSFQYNNRSLFSHLTNVFGPIGYEVQHAIGKSFSRSYKKSKELGQSMIKKSSPVFSQKVQKLKSSQSARIKKTREKAMESLEEDEIRKLDDLIKDDL